MSSSYAAHYRRAVKALARPLTVKDGTPARQIATAERRLRVRLPKALREFYRLAGQLDQLNRAHNRLYTPDEWFVDAGKLVFMEENQVVVYWGVEADRAPAEDPPVLQGVNVIDQPIDWHPEHPCCSEFLVFMLYWQAVCGGMEFTGLADISPKQRTRLRAAWPFIGQSSDMLVFGADGWTACVIGKGKALQVIVGGRTQSDFDKAAMEFARLGVELGQV